MSNIYVESKGPKGPQIKESLQLSAVPASQPSRGLAVAYSTDQFHVAVVAALESLAIGILEEDAIVTVRGGVSVVGEPNAVIEFGQAVAQIGANVALQQPLTANAAGQLVPAGPGQQIVAVALEAQQYVAPGSFACVFVLAALGLTMPGDEVTYIAAAGAIPVVSGTYVINGAAALAMALAAPTAAQDGTKLTLIAGTSHAHTVTTPADCIEGTKDTVTFAAAYDICQLEAVNQKWAVRSIGGPTPASLSEV